MATLRTANCLKAVARCFNVRRFLGTVPHKCRDQNDNDPKNVFSTRPVRTGFALHYRPLNGTARRIWRRRLTIPHRAPGFFHLHSSSPPHLPRKQRVGRLVVDVVAERRAPESSLRHLRTVCPGKRSFLSAGVRGPFVSEVHRTNPVLILRSFTPATVTISEVAVYLSGCFGPARKKCGWRQGAQTKESAHVSRAAY
jgi:hypothetical protein